MNDLPVVRVEFEQMRHSMLTAINQHLEEISVIAEQQLKELLSDKNFLNSVHTQVELMARSVITQSVESALRREMGKHIDDMVSARYKKLWEDLYPPTPAAQSAETRELTRRKRAMHPIFENITDIFRTAGTFPPKENQDE